MVTRRPSQLRPVFSSSTPRTAQDPRATLSGLLLLLGLTLPVMRYLIVAGERVNACAADAVLLPLTFVLRRWWLQGGALGQWLFALWVVNLISWSSSLSLLTPQAFLRESLKVVTCFLYALVGYAIGRQAAGERTFVSALVLSSTAIAGGAMCAYTTRHPAYLILDSRVVGTFTDPNAFGVFLAMQVALVAGLRSAWVIIPILLGGGAVTLSRTGLVSLASSLTLSSIQLGLRRFLVIGAICVVTLVAIWGASPGNALSHRIVQYETTLGNRQELWSNAMEAGLAHPLFGIGRGNWEAATGQRDVAHNTFLQVIAELGFVGFCVFIVPLVLWVGAGLQRQATRTWAISLLIGLVGGMAISLDNFRLFWLATGVLVAKLAAEAGATRARLALSPGAAQRAAVWGTPIAQGQR